MDNEKKVMTFSGVIVSNHGVVIHPEFWEELAQAPPEVQEEVKTLIAAFQTASENTYQKYGAAATQEDFEQELERLTGATSKSVDESVDREMLDKMQERLLNFPTKH